jgi:hypothetical protein
MNRISLATIGLATMLLAGGCKVVIDDVGQSTYETCDFTSDCNSVLDACVTVTNGSFTDSQCTPTCIDDLDCPGTGHCVSFDGVNSHCYQTCITSGICEPGWGCSDLSDGSAVCLPGTGTPTDPGIPAYNECTPGSTGECTASVDGCFTIDADGAVAGVCTSTCSSSRACPVTAGGLVGECIAFDGVNFTCFEACDTSADCLTGFACKNSLADGTTFPPICLPI